MIDADGTVVASGKTTASLINFDPSTLDLAVARYTAKGQLDATFNGTGKVIEPMREATPAAQVPLPNQSRAPKKTCSCASQIRKANMPRSSRTIFSPR